MSGIDKLSKHNFKFNKSFGQNFIFDTNLLNAIVRDAGINETSTVLEIGAGAGTLTSALSKTAKRVLAYEIDENLKPILQENLKEFDNCEVVFKDILKEPTSEIEKKLNTNYSIIANLPYYITSPIIFKFLEESTMLNKMAIMVQKEVAERMVAKENTKDYGLLTVSVNAIANTKIARIVKRDMFTPAPNVDSAIVLIEMNSKKFDIKNFDLFKQVTKSAFNMRRKTLTNNLKNTFSYSQTQLEKVFEKLSLPINIRGEALSVEQFVNLSNELNKL